MAVPHHPVAPVRQVHALHQGQERLGFRFDGWASSRRAPLRRTAVSGLSIASGCRRGTTVLFLIMAYRSFGRFRQASTRLGDVGGLVHGAALVPGGSNLEN
jgi:hypothetical protein